MSVPDHYGVLGVEPDAKAEEIRSAWRFSIEAFHPDRYANSDQRQRAHDMATRVNAAWDVLGDPARRRDYDLTLRASSSHPVAVTREVICPACLARCGVPDQRGKATDVRCPSCRASFRAYIGATLVGKPQLVWKGLRAHHVLVLLDGTRALTEVVARKLPAELALTEGGTVTVILGGRREQALFLIVHGNVTDFGWRVG